MIAFMQNAHVPWKRYASVNFIACSMCQHHFAKPSPRVDSSVSIRIFRADPFPAQVVVTDNDFLAKALG
jgi:hypothetical protein